MAGLGEIFIRLVKGVIVIVFKRLATGMLGSNCYILGDKGEGVIIDPGADSGEILKIVKSEELQIKYIIITHVHIDHIYFVDEVSEETGAKVIAHQGDAAAFADQRFNGSALFGLNKTFKPADIVVNDGDIIEAGGLQFEIIHTPGHTPGGISIKLKDKVFTGDTLFRMSIGRTDLGNGDQDDLIRSIKSRLFCLDDDTIVYPGHGTTSTIGYEKKHNPYV